MDTRQCANDEAEPQRGVDMRRCASKDVGSQLGDPVSIGEEMSASEDVGPRRGVNCEIPHRLRRRTKYSL